MELWTAFILGLAGSFHCAAMCGPLVLALPTLGGSLSSLTAGRLAYHLGRVSTYALIGAVLGLIGQSFVLAGLQRWLSLGVGGLVLAGCMASFRRAVGTPAVRVVVRVKQAWSRLLQRRSLSSQVLLGMLNGILPCGLVYVAGAGATATGGFVSGIAYMVSFGLGTFPMMLGLGLIRHPFRRAALSFSRKLVPMSAAALGLLLILRGLSLGIPYLSPDISGANVLCATCR